MPKDILNPEPAPTIADLAEAIERKWVRATRQGDEYVIRWTDLRMWREQLRRGKTRRSHQARPAS